jgi:hypothetical protein
MSLPLHTQRYRKVFEVLKRFHCRSLLDAGCSEGGLEHYLLDRCLQHYSLEDITAVDVDMHVLQMACHRRAAIPGGLSQIALLHPCRVTFVCVDLTAVPCSNPSQLSQGTRSSDHDDDDGKEGVQPPSLSHRPCGDGDDDGEGQASSISSYSWGLLPPRGDAIASVEVVEHIPPLHVARYLWSLLVEIGPTLGCRVLILTTPNRDTNVSFFKRNESSLSSFPSTRLRHPDHKFEWTMSEFRDVLDYLFTSPPIKGYWVLDDLFYLGGFLTQGFVVRRRDDPKVFLQSESDIFFRSFSANFPAPNSGPPSTFCEVHQARPASVVGTVILPFMSLMERLEEAIIDGVRYTMREDGGTCASVCGIPLSRLVLAPAVLSILETVSLVAVRMALEGLCGSFAPAAALLLERLAVKTTDSGAAGSEAEVKEDSRRGEDFDKSDERGTFTRSHLCLVRARLDALYCRPSRCAVRKRARQANVSPAAAETDEQLPGPCDECMALLYIAAATSTAVLCKKVQEEAPYSCEVGFESLVRAACMLRLTAADPPDEPRFSQSDRDDYDD